MLTKPTLSEEKINGFLVNSLPKAGTHLVQKALRLMPGVRFTGITLGYSSRRKGNLLDRMVSLLGLRAVDRWLKELGRPSSISRADQGTLSLGVVSPRDVREDLLRRILDFIHQQGFATSHMMYSDQTAALLEERHMKMILVLRDPRDVVISQANYIPGQSGHFLHKLYQDLSFDERVLLSIQGKPGRFLSICSRMDGIIPWLDKEYVHPVRFEDLVGPEGGGSRSSQLAALKGMSDFLDLDLSRDTIEAIAGSLFGGTETFRRGRAGAWREAFNADHVQAFKTSCSQTLIRLGYEEDDHW